MNQRVILPPDYPETNQPVVFLAGPITGAPDWQEQAISYLTGNSSNIFVASPRRNIPFTDGSFYEQVDWETHFLRLAGKSGTVLFWLACQIEPHPRGAYAQTTRFELGEWVMRHQYDASSLAIGIESGFPNENYIRYRLSQDCPELEICSTVEESCQQAIEKCSRSK